MEPSTALVVCFIVLRAAIANCYPKGEISTANSKPLIVDNHVKRVENGTIGKYDWTEKWEAPGRLKSWFPYHIIGKDEEGASSKAYKVYFLIRSVLKNCAVFYFEFVVYLVPYGHWNFRDLIIHGTEEEVQGIDKYLEQVVDRFSRDAEANNNDGAVFIFDYDGFGLGNYAHPEGINLFLNSNPYCNCHLLCLI